MAGRPPAYSYALSECVFVCVWGGKASDFPIYNYNFIVFTIFIVALASYRTHSDTDLDSDSAIVGVGGGAGEGRRTGDRIGHRAHTVW